MVVGKKGPLTKQVKKRQMKHLIQLPGKKPTSAFHTLHRPYNNPNEVSSHAQISGTELTFFMGRPAFFVPSWELGGLLATYVSTYIYYHVRWQQV